MSTLKRMPPPPPIAVNDPIFNRWLHDLTAFISSSGGIDTGEIPGYSDLAQTVDAHTTEIDNNTASITDNTNKIAANTVSINNNAAAITANTNAIATHTGQIASLASRSQVRNGTTAPAAGLGVDGDWYADTAAHHIHVKVAGAWVLIV